MATNRQPDSMPLHLLPESLQYRFRQSFLRLLLPPNVDLMCLMFSILYSCLLPFPFRTIVVFHRLIILHDIILAIKEILRQCKIVRTKKAAIMTALSLLCVGSVLPPQTAQCIAKRIHYTRIMMTTPYCCDCSKQTRNDSIRECQS